MLYIAVVPAGKQEPDPQRVQTITRFFAAIQ